MSYPKTRISKKAPRSYTNKEWLYEQYIIMNKPASQIARDCGCKEDTIKDWVRRHDIKKGPHVQGRDTTPLYKQRDYLYEEHVVKGRKIKDIAKEHGVKNGNIIYWMNKYNIEYTVDLTKLELDEEKIIEEYLSGVSENQVAINNHCARGSIKGILEAHGICRRGLSEAQYAYLGKEKPEELNYDWLYHHYIELGENGNLIGKNIGVDGATVRRYLVAFDIPIRDESESKIGIQSGDKHHNWKGGKTPLDLLLREFFHTNIAPMATKRDNYTCQRCGATHAVLHAHHIIHFKDIVDEIIAENPEISIETEDGKQQMYDIIVKDPRFLDVDNLITLCKSCHQEIHSKEKTSSQASEEEGSETIESLLDE